MSSQEFRPPRQPLQNWHVNWESQHQVFSEVKKHWTIIERPPPAALQPLLSWVYRRRNGTIRDFGSRFADLFITKLGIGQDEEWRFAHALGRGGFGAVAMFERRNPTTQAIEDQVAVKTTQARQDLAVDDNRINLSMEAAFMAQTNEIDADGMLILRQYKHYEVQQQWKYYFEYCPYGDLERLRVRYKAYGRCLPELFLWHLFYWLSKTVREYSPYNDWYDIDHVHWGQAVNEGYLLHSDIKTQNVLLGPPDPDDDDAINLYPIPRVADLGLASVETRHDPDSIAAHLVKGTTMWHPPEIRWKEMLQHTQYYPFARRPNPDMNDRFRKGRHRVTSKANVWAIGAIMFSMATLKECTHLHDLTNSILNEVIPLSDAYESIINDHDFSTEIPQYSQELRDLIGGCLRLVPQNRPDEEILVRTCYQRYHRHLANLKSQGYGSEPTDTMSLQEAVDTLPEYKVYYRENEIDRAPDNDQYHYSGRTPAWWTGMFVSDWAWLPHHWGKLWPATMPLNTLPPGNWPTGWQDAMNAARVEVMVNRHPSQQPPPQQQQQQNQPFFPAPLLAAAPAQQQAQLAPPPRPRPQFAQPVQPAQPFEPQYDDEDYLRNLPPLPQSVVTITRAPPPAGNPLQQLRRPQNPQQQSWGPMAGERDGTLGLFDGQNQQAQHGAAAGGHGHQRNLGGDMTMDDVGQGQQRSSDGTDQRDVVGALRNRWEGAHRFAPYFIPRRGRRNDSSSN